MTVSSTLVETRMTVGSINDFTFEVQYCSSVVWRKLARVDDVRSTKLRVLHEVKLLIPGYVIRATNSTTFSEVDGHNYLIEGVMICVNLRIAMMLDRCVN